MQKFLYSIDEIKILNHIAIIYTRIGEHKKATDIYSRLLKYTKKHYNNPQKSEGLFLLISYNYAHELCNLKRYEEAIQVGEAGVHMATQYGHCMVLPATLSVLAESYYFLGHKEKSRILYTQSYAIATVLGNDCDCKDIKEDAKKYLNIEFDY
jgi:tetratricopeptide (TPR) repeat protein